MHKLDVYFLGQYKIVLDDKYILNYEDIGSQKNAKLLAYLLKNYRTKQSGQEIQDIMFSDNSSSNPGNALKALVYRLRVILKKYFGDIDIIASGNSTYYLNPEIEVSLDIDVFDRLISQGGCQEDDDSKVKYYKQAVDLYQGAFLPMLSEEQWVIITGTYLESSYMNTVVYLLERYLSSKNYDLVEQLSKQALNYDSLNENLHYYLIKSLINQNKISLAKQHYLSTEKFLYDELGTNPSEALQSLYEEIISGQRSKEATMNDLQNNLIESSIQGAFLCSFETFKKIYQLEVRKAIRRGFSEYIVLLTIEPKEHIKSNTELMDAVIESTSRLLDNTISTTLRVGDTYTKYSNQQFLLLLPDCTDANARKVVERITNNFYKRDKYQRVVVNSKIDEIRLMEVVNDGKVLSVK